MTAGCLTRPPPLLVGAGHGARVVGVDDERMMSEESDDKQKKHYADLYFKQIGVKQTKREKETIGDQRETAPGGATLAVPAAEQRACGGADVCDAKRLTVRKAVGDQRT